MENLIKKQILLDFESLKKIFIRYDFKNLKIEILDIPSSLDARIIFYSENRSARHLLYLELAYSNIENKIYSNPTLANNPRAMDSITDKEYDFIYSLYKTWRLSENYKTNNRHVLRIDGR